MYAVWALCYMHRVTVKCLVVENEMYFYDSIIKFSLAHQYQSFGGEKQKVPKYTCL